MKDTFVLVSVALGGLLLMILILAAAGDVLESGANDFLTFYAGAHLLESGELYDARRLHEVSAAVAGAWSPEHGYVRPPFHAVLVWPLTRLSYPSAWRTWLILNAAAFAGSIALWRPPRFAVTLAFSMLSLPVFTAIGNGQDIPFVLLFLAAAVSLHRRGRPFAAGLMASLCAIKFHLFLLAPVWLAARREWRTAQGLAAGAIVLLLVSFLAAGAAWPSRFLSSATDPAFSPRAAGMPNLHGLLAGVPQGWAAEAGIGLLVAGAVWCVARGNSITNGIAAMLTGGLLVSRHAYFADAALLLPAALLALDGARGRAQRLTAFLLLTAPVAYNEATAAVVPRLIALLSLGLLGLLAVEASRGQTSRAVSNDATNPGAPAEPTW